MELMIKRRKLGRTGLMISELGFGAMNLRLLPRFEDAKKIVNFVLDSGVNFIDTARAYKGEIAPGVMLESEKVVGEVIRGRTDLKEPVVIITKGHGYTLPVLEQELAESRDALGIEGRGSLKIGGNDVKLIYFLHGISEERWAVIKSSGVLERLRALKSEGLVDFVGFSSHYPYPKEIKEAVDTGVFDVVELPYNVFNRSLGEDGELDLLRYIHDKEIGLINMKAFDGNGMVPLYKIIREVVSIDYEKMLRFCLSNPYITSVDAGARLVEEYALDLQTAQSGRYGAAELQALKTEADKISSQLDHVCRACMHCMEKFECPNGVDFPKILSAYSRYSVYSQYGKDTSGLAALYSGFEKNGSDCIACGACLPWCEYKLDIPGMLRQAHQALGR